MSDDDQRKSDRRWSDRRAAANVSGRALVPAGERRDETPSARAAPKSAGDPAFSAQLLGQDGQKRGLRGGAPVLNAARSTYLETEYSGDADRRPRKGGAKVEDV
ncbi:MAG: hypothetical protein EON88_23005 [Brevundimonas sp.]|nr:MAG: hypothetical protein EON88_23005 [Brevundimonas sp.]